MEKLEFKFKKIEKTKIHSDAQFLADQIWEWSGKRLSFPLLMKMIKTKGRQFVFECWNEIRRENPKDKVKLFMWKIGQVKINWS